MAQVGPTVDVHHLADIWVTPLSRPISRYSATSFAEIVNSRLTATTRGAIHIHSAQARSLLTAATVRRYREDLRKPAPASARSIALAVIIAVTLCAVAAILPMAMPAPFA